MDRNILHSRCSVALQVFLPHLHFAVLIGAQAINYEVLAVILNSL